MLSSYGYHYSSVPDITRITKLYMSLFLLSYILLFNELWNTMYYK